MKKIKSKLIYVNPCAKTAHKPSKSPSPDSKNRSKIQKTNSPVKQVQHYYKLKNNTIGFSCTQDQKHKKTHHQNNPNPKKVSSFSLNDSHESIDLNNISQNIKLKSPSSLYHSSTYQNSINKQYFPSCINEHYQTPKAKCTSFKHEFTQDPNQLTQNYQSQIKSSTKNQDKNFEFSLQYHLKSKNNQNKNHQASLNKKSKKKLEIFSPMINSSKQKPTKDSPNKSDSKNSLHLSLHQNMALQESHMIQHQRNQSGNIDQKDLYIFELQRQLQQKQKQIKKMSLYMNEYEKLGAKNKKLEKDMKQILGKLIQMKSQQEHSLKVSQQSESHNQFHQDQSSSYRSSNQAQNETFSQINESEPSSQIQKQNTHEEKGHKKCLTDDYIKIYDDLQSSSYLNIEEQEQSYKPNFMKYSQLKKEKNNNSPSSHRKMLSVGARLKQSLNAKNQDFKASFDDSILLSSSSSQKLSQRLISSPKQNRTKKYDFSKKQHLKTQQTQEGTVSLKQIETYREYDSFSSIENNNQDYLPLARQPNSKIKIIDQFYEDLQKKTEEQTTVKKSKVKYSIKKKTQEQLFSQRNVDTLIETNKKLTSIIQNLMKSHDSMFLEVKRMSQKNQMYVNKMTQIQEEFNQIKVNFTQLTLSSQEILNSVKSNFGSQFSFKNTLITIEQKVNKLYQSLNENTKEMKRQNSQKQTWLESNQITHTTPYLSKITSFGKQSETQKQKKVRKESGSEFKQPVSPSFTYLQESASFLTDSFRLSHSDRSNPSNSRFNYCSTVEDQINIKSVKQSQKKLPKYEDQSKILIIQDSIYGSSESNLLSNGTSQFIQVDSGRGVSQKSGTSRDKIKSENSEIRINFDDLEEDVVNYKANFEIIERQDENKSNYGKQLYQESISLMKSSFGPIIQKQMSRSEKGDSIAGQIRDEVHEVDFNNQTPQKPFNRPRQNSSINIFFSSDSICKTNKAISHIPHDLPYYKTTQNNSSQQSSFKSAKCSQCFSKEQQIKKFQTEASQMRNLISQLNQEKDKLQKLVKSKIQIIDNLQISLKQLQSLSNLEQTKSKKEFDPIQIYRNKSKKEEQFGYSNTSFKDRNSQDFLLNKNTNRFMYSPQNNNTQYQKSTIFDIKPIKFGQIQDLLPITTYLSKQIGSDKIQSLKSIQIEIQKQLLKQQEIQRELHEKFMKERGNTLDWAKGSFSKVDEFREESFIKTKAILIKLIGLIRQFISQGGQHVRK